MKSACALLGLVVACAPATARGEPPQPKALAPVDAALQQQINAAIERGVARLRTLQRQDGSWAGEFGSAGQTGLALYTLLCSGVAKDDPAVRRAADLLERLEQAEGSVQDVMADRPPALRMTYDHALLVLSLSTRDPVAHRAAIRRSVQVLVSEQRPSGQWAYSVTMGGPLDGGDNSNTQFALLALRHAALAGFAVPKAVWQRASRHFESTVGKDGGWGYGCPGTLEGSYGSMTAVGMACLVICKAMLLGPEKAGGFAYLSLPAMEGGLKWLLTRFAADRNPDTDRVVQGAGPGGPAGPPGGPPGGGAMPRPSAQTFHFYWLYAVERLGMLLNLRHIGFHEWYREGAQWLVAAQAADGGWSNPAGSMGAPEPPLAATCFALLFLRRATLPVVTEPALAR